MRFDISANQLAGATLVMLMVGMGAGIVPAQRASRIDPLAALRRE